MAVYLGGFFCLKPEHDDDDDNDDDDEVVHSEVQLVILS